MRSSSGSFPASLRPSSDRRWRGLLALACLPLFAAATPQPDYLRTALSRFSPNPPDGWAYTITTVRNEWRMMERYDPARPPAARWSLLELEGRPPTPDELQKYARSRPEANSGGAQANFQRSDIEPASLQLVQEDEIQAVWSARFREASAAPDKMLGHLGLRLVVDKRTAHVSSFVLELKEPYSPVLGVRMNRLRAETRYHPPAGDEPARPAVQTSSFAGRVFFIPTQEELEVRFTDYAPAPTELSR